MVLFFTTEWSNNQAILHDEEARHCIKVLRKREGEQVSCTNGSGLLAHCIIHQILKDSVILDIQESTQQDLAKNTLSLSVIPTKNASRMEWMVEKCTEMGISSFKFAFSKNSERKVLKLNRLHKIALSAMKQSQRVYLPSIELMDNFDHLVNSFDENAQNLIAHYNEDNTHISQMQWKAVNNILIGPEGDFTQEELELCANKGFQAINLSNARLRTETAGLLSCAAFNVINQA